MTLRHLGRKENRKELDKILSKVFGYETVWIAHPYDNPRCSRYYYYRGSTAFIAKGTDNSGYFKIETGMFDVKYIIKDKEILETLIQTSPLNSKIDYDVNYNWIEQIEEAGKKIVEYLKEGDKSETQ